METSTPKQQIGRQEFIHIMDIIQDYFDGLYYADVKKLRRIFHKDAFLKAPNLRRSLDFWLEAVDKRPTPVNQGQPYNFKIISIEVIKDQAMVKLDCPLYDFEYVDYLGLLKENGRWLIVNKMYTDTRVINK